MNKQIKLDLKQALGMINMCIDIGDVDGIQNYTEDFCYLIAERFGGR